MGTVKSLQKIQGIMIFAVALGYLAWQLVQDDWMQRTVLACCVVMTLLLFPQVRGITLLISTCMLGVGHLLFWIYDLEWTVWQEAVLFNLNLITLFASVPLLSLPIQYGGYMHSLERVLLLYAGKKKAFFTFISAITFVIGSIMNLGVIRLLYGFLKSVPYRRDWVGRALLVGFVSTIMWSPYFASVALVIKALHLNYSDFAPFAVSEALLLFLAGNLMVTAQMNRQSAEFAAVAHGDRGGVQGQVTAPCTPEDRKKVKQLAVIMAAMLVSLILLEKWTGIKVMVLAAYVSILVTVTWMLYLGKAERLKECAKEYLYKLLPSIGNEVILFLSAGFFGVILLHTPFNALLVEQLQKIDGLWPIARILLFVAMPVILSLIGVHQIITVTILATSIDPALIGLHPVAFGILLMASWSISTIVSPVTPVNITLGILLRENSLTVGLGRNYGYALTVILLTTGFVFAINQLLR
ncbi:MAG: hypothetical protein H0Z34_00115 [Brevibacillus sp.]|nr:hypothetical protein [Brevibacillus sp.]